MALNDPGIRMNSKPGARKDHGQAAPRLAR